MKKTLLAFALASAGLAFAQNAPLTNTLGDYGTVHEQVIGDVNSTADHTNSVSTQLGNSANANGAQVNPNIDTRDQNTVTSTGGSVGNTSATGNLSNNDNKSSASNGNQSMGQANTGNSSVGNTSATNGPNTLTGGNNTATNTAMGGAGGSVAGSGNSANANTNTTNTTNALGQQQGIAGSGNSTNTVKGGDQSNTSSNRNANAQGQGQQQAATAAQGQGQGQSSNNRVSGGNQSATTTSRSNQDASTRSGVGQSGNSATNVNTGGNIDNSRVDARALFIPRVTPDTPPSMLAAGTMQVVADPICGPLQDTVNSPVQGVAMGWFWDSAVDLGNTQQLVQYRDQNGEPVYFLEVNLGGRKALLGHRVTTAYAILGVAAGKNFGLGGGGSNMQWGQAGAGNSSSMQRMVQQTTLRQCIYDVEKLPPQQPVYIPPPPRADRG